MTKVYHLILLKYIYIYIYIYIYMCVCPSKIVSLAVEEALVSSYDPKIWWKLQVLAGLPKPGRSKGRILTNRWSNRWQYGEGIAHRQIQLGVFWLRVTVALGKALRLLVGAASINSQISNRKKTSEEIRSVTEWASEIYIYIYINIYIYT